MRAPALILTGLALLAEISRGAKIPFIDLQGFIGVNATIETRLLVAKQWDKALRLYGFAALTNHGVSVGLQEGLFDAAASFFSQELHEKLAARQSLQYGGGGYTPPGVESVARTVDGRLLPPDLVENFVFLPGALPLNKTGTSGDRLGESAWEYWQQMSLLVSQLHQLSAVALGLGDVNFFSSYYDPDPSYALRLAYYPPIDRGGMSCAANNNDDELGRFQVFLKKKRKLVKALRQWVGKKMRALFRRPQSHEEGELRCSSSSGSVEEEGLAAAVEAGGVRYGAHTDYQGFTILRPDPTQPGLEVFVPMEAKQPTPDNSKNLASSKEGEGGDLDATREGSDSGGGDGGEWVPVSEDEISARGALVVNIGDLFQQWTNDRWRSTLHRVKNPPKGTAAAGMPRLSLVFFTGPREDSVIEVLQECVAPGQAPKYQPIVAGDHLRAKLAASNTAG
jgi:isopenicillin N synthase-like dioxygenase